MLTPVMFFVDIVSDLSDITLRLGGLPLLLFVFSIVVSPLFLFRRKLIFFDRCAVISGLGVSPTSRCIFVRVRRKIQCLLFLMRCRAVFCLLYLCISQAFAVPSANLERKRLHPLRRTVGVLTRSRFSVMLSIIITLEIVNWYGAVIAQSGRQFDESGG